MLSDNLEPVTARNHAMSPLDKVLVTLRFLATGKMQLCNADDMELSQPSVSRAVTQTLSAINDPRIVKRFISFPLTQRQVINNALDFASVANFPNVVGVIDGTHVQILAPHVNEPAFVNRKHYHSINTQVVFDADYRILDIVAKWPGSTHDSRILRESGLQVLFETGRVPPNAHLLGDSGYPSKTWLLTPYLRPNNAVKHAYNRSHKRTRSIVERGIGQLKRRFHALHVELRLSPQKACQVIVACAILHNICKMRNIPEPEESSGSPPDSRQPDTIPHLPSSSRSNTATSGVSYRDQFQKYISHSSDILDRVVAGKLLMMLQLMMWQLMMLHFGLQQMLMTSSHLVVSSWEAAELVYQTEPGESSSPARSWSLDCNTQHIVVNIFSN